MLSRVRRVAPVVLVVLAALLAGSGFAVAATPGDPGSDFGDGATTTHADGRVGVRAARTTTVNPASGPDFEMPFGCGQTWTGSSRAGHSPSYYAIDWNSTNDLGKPVLATAPGIVTTARSLTTSYGRYVVVDHGNGYSSLYGHLNQIVAVVGQYVDQGDLIGYLGSTGNSTGPHLHFEERLNGAYFPPYFHRKTFKINSSLTSANCTDRPAVGDWNGDGTTDLGVLRNTAADTVFYERAANGTNSIVPWGATADRPAVGDYDGDHVSQVGVRRLTSGSWTLRSGTGAQASSTGIGLASDVPLTGDWDGNGRANLGYYRYSNHSFYLRGETGTYTTASYGRAGDLPVVGDWDGDGKADLGVFRPSTHLFYLRVKAGSGFTSQTFSFGRLGDLPVAGDWNHDGKAEVGVWRPSTAQFFLRIPVGAGLTSTTTTYGLPRG